MQYILPGHFDEVANTHFSQGIRTGNLVFVAGQLAVDNELRLLGNEDAAAQARRIFEAFKRILAAAGATLQDVVWLQFFMIDVGDREKITPARREYFGDNRPVSTLIQVPKLAVPGARLEVNAIAALGNKQYIGEGHLDQLINTHYSEGIRVGDLVFVAGQGAHDANFKIVDKDNTGVQAHQILGNIRGIVEHAKSRLEDAVWTQAFMTDVRDEAKVEAQYVQFGRARPCKSTVEVSALAMPGMRLEINCIASLDKDKQYIAESPRTDGHISSAVRAGKMVFISGSAPLDERGEFVGKQDIAAQARQIFNNMSKVLGKAGGSLRDVTWLQLFLKDVNQRTKITPVRRELFGEHRPVATLVEMRDLPVPEMLLEVNGIAVLEN